nr:unnamed protein product [Callosobruchus analis]
MKTVVSKTGVEVLYPCTVHLINDEVWECEYKSDHNGKELLDFVCDKLNLQERDYWGLKYLDQFDQRHWLDMNILIRAQVKNISCPLKFYFRMKVYPPEPYKLADPVAKTQIFYQLRSDLLNGTLSCGASSDASLLVALFLQRNLGDYDPNEHIGHYVNEKFLMNQTFAVEAKAIEIHKLHLVGLSQEQTEDLLLRMACQLETYGIDPYLVEDENGVKLTLWINYKGLMTYHDAKKVHHLEWMNICKILRDNNKLFVYLMSGDFVILSCLTAAECDYIFLGAVQHLVIFTSTSTRSTIGLNGSESAEDMYDEIRSLMNDAAFEVATEEDCYCYETDSGTECDRKSDVCQGDWWFYNPKVWHLAVIIAVFSMGMEMYSMLDAKRTQYYWSLNTFLDKFMPNKLF